MENIDIIIAAVTLLGGYFGLPKLIDAGMRRRQIASIKKKAEKLAAKIIVDRNKKSLQDEPLLDEVKNLLFKAKDSSKNKEFLQKQLNTIIRNLYDASMDEDIIELKEKFHDHFEFDAESWANIAISNMNLYRLDGMNEFRENSIEACRESIKRKANYGTPRAVILILNMIDYERKKQIHKDDIKNMLLEVISGDDTLVSFYTYDYLLRTKNIKEWGKYIDHLDTLFPQEMNRLLERYNSFNNPKKEAASKQVNQ
jgi:hypothetical protein